MKNNDRFDEKVTIDLRMDEAIVLLWYLSREIWNRGSSRLEGTFAHPAESHGVQALLQELATRLIHTGSESMRGIEQTARASLMRRYADDDGSAE
jgi:hypothetical protein